LVLRIRFGVPAALLACLSVTACAWWSGDKGPITVGAIYNLNGAQMLLDIPSSEGAQLAVDRANEDGGVLGRKIVLQVVDGQSTPRYITEVTRNLLEKDPTVVGLIGLSDTDMVLAAAPVAARYKKVFLNSGASSPRLPSQVPKYLFLACFGDNVQAAAGAEWAYQTLKAHSVAVIFNADTVYTQLLHGYFETRFTQLGGKVASVQSYRLADFKVADFKVNLDSLRKADLVYFAAYPDDVTTVIPLLRKAGVAAPILGGDGLDIGDAWKKIPTTRNVYFTTHAHLGADNPDLTVQRFRSLYRAAHPTDEPDAFTALGYDAANLMIAAIEKADSVEPAAVLKALAATRDFHGVTGTISYLGGSRIPTKSVTIMRIDGGQERFVGTIMPEHVPAP
jgi:branched-chain amino acid transport system substrate-binding protein